MTSRRSSRATPIVAAVVAVGAILALAWVAFGRSVETPEDSAAPATETTEPPLAEPSETPTPTPEQPEALPPIIGLTAAGDLVEIDPTSGATLRTFATDAALEGPLSLTPDRSTVYLTRKTGDFQYDIVRVSVADGTTEVVTQGRVSSLSPDGTRLAFVGAHPTNPDGEYRALHILDLTTGEVAYIPDNSCGGCPRRIDQPAWAPDGARLYVAAGFQDSALPSMDILVVVPGTSAELDAAEVFVPNDTFTHGEPGNPGFLADGSLVVVSVAYFGTGDSADGLTSHWGAIETFDPATATTIGLWDFPQLHSIDLEESITAQTADTATAPSGTAMAVVAMDWSGPAPVGILYLWQGGEDLATLATGIVAVAW